MTETYLVAILFHIAVPDTSLFRKLNLLAYQYVNQLENPTNFKHMKGPLIHLHLHLSNHYMSHYYFLELNGPSTPAGPGGVFGPEESAAALLDDEEVALLLDLEGSISSTCNK